MSARIVLGTFAVFLSCLPRQLHGDLPVHCLRHQIVGDWRLTLGKAESKRSSCGHQRPDSAEAQPLHKVVGSKTTDVLVSLRSPNVVVVGAEPKGTWTMVFDEGFEINLFDGRSFLAFSNFSFQVDRHDKQHNVSHNVSDCSRTMVGWYQNANRTEFGCYFGTQTLGLARTELTLLAEAESHSRKSGPASRLASGAYDRPLDDESQGKFVSMINRRISTLQLGWRARTMSRWNGKSMREINGYVGMRRPRSMKQHHAEMLRQQARPARAKESFLQTRSVKITVPQAWDWSEAHGANFLEPVMDQSDCGSCYATSSVRMLSARHKISINDTNALPWSINFPLHCSEYNQGCQGGYGFLLTKWSTDVGLLPATCMRYNPVGKCTLECDLKKLKGKRYRAANHRYVGSFYGAHPRVNAILEELYLKGPLAVGIQVDEDFSFYGGGVYSSTVKRNVSDATHQEWERVDHGVLLVGWGQEGAQKYWRLQNSWGEDWGEDGFFRIASGVDEAAIESMVEAADVVEDEQAGRQVDDFFFREQPRSAIGHVHERVKEINVSG